MYLKLFIFSVCFFTVNSSLLAEVKGVLAGQVFYENKMPTICLDGDSSIQATSDCGGNDIIYPLKNSPVIIKSLNKKITKGLYTDSYGQFKVSLPKGRYLLKSVAQQEIVRVRANKATIVRHSYEVW